MQGSTIGLLTTKDTRSLHNGSIVLNFGSVAHFHDQLLKA